MRPWRSGPLSGWQRLPREEQAAIGYAVDHGIRMSEPRLRPLAAALAAGLLSHNGWRLLRHPAYLGLVVASLAALAAFGLWWWLAADILLLLVCLWLVERQARRLRPLWRQAVEANSGPPGRAAGP